MIKKTLFFGNPAYLSLQDRQMLIRFPDKESGNLSAGITRPIEDLGVVVLDNRQITVTSGLLQALLDNTTAVITCDHRGMPSGLLLPLTGNTVQSERFQDQITASVPLRKQLWQQTVAAKIRNQAFSLYQCQGIEAENMLAWSKSVKSGDSENMEARAAAYYWKNLFSDLYPVFYRFSEGEPPNNLLNYGYAILRSIVARALVVSGLLPTLGIHHHNRYNAFCLADDIMEPYRPYVDILVFDIIHRYDNIETLTKELKKELLAIPTLDTIINDKRSPLMVAVGLTTASLYKCFSGESRTILYPDMSLS